ncbi:hypothetical protein [Bermanella sp. R86510]|uniref:hypothetical protein n=1 Tax=unclassified Bermanella TaxID=2627862 RepID=UPI0037C8F22B
MRIIILLLFITLSSTGVASNANNADWFQFNPEQNTYSIDSSDVHPSILLRQLALTSGVEILYDNRLKKPIDLYTKRASINQVVADLERDYSTITRYRKNKQGKDVLAKLTILPKGHLSSDDLSYAVLPIEEAINLRSGDMSESAKPTFLTRLDYLETEIKELLLEKAEKIAQKRERREQKIKNKRQQKQDELTAKRSELEALKQQDPELYQRKKSIFEAVHGKSDSQVGQ